MYEKIFLKFIHDLLNFDIAGNHLTDHLLKLLKESDVMLTSIRERQYFQEIREKLYEVRIKSNDQ